ncbi:glutathione peroxidase [Bacillus norwichensis]|uniref:Glutathione peroxidase n=1 Tax=Bacillus norwichensis TaxID=2762217 RepID=A0ABR8VQT4_9BACI|nr:glutathione peroxidase [Bacillus norwichensis]MBD8007123.1 glutathione peroxidase [Bacillus norwichensis]
MTIFDITVKRTDGKELSLSEFQGKVLLIVNTASKCGFTPQLKELQQLHDTYKDQGFTVLGFPSDQFMKQEFDDIQQTLDFCQINYGVSFPVFAKVQVKGEGAHPLFRFLIDSKKGVLTKEIKWNFTKFLIDRQGQVVKRYAPQTNPSKIKQVLEDLL